MTTFSLRTGEAPDKAIENHPTEGTAGCWGRSVVEAVEIAQGLARKIAESCMEHGDPLPSALARLVEGPVDFVVPVGLR